MASWCHAKAFKQARRLQGLLSEPFLRQNPRMKSLLLIAAMLLPSSLQAGLKWERTLQQVEWKKGQREATVEFPYKNAGKTSQKITKLKGACACCTAARASKKDLAPGESGVVRVRMDLSGKTLPAAKAVAVTTADGEVVSLVVQITTPDGQEVKIPKWSFKR
jgi:hypothetical protein